MPSEYTIRTTYLDRLTVRAETHIGNVLAESKYLTVATDAWSSLRNDSVINYLAMSESRESVLVSAAVHQGSHTGESLKKHFIKHCLKPVFQVGKDRALIEITMLKKIVAVVSDSASNALKMRRLITEVRSVQVVNATNL